MPAAGTLTRILPVARAIGVTRLADVTGLDRIGIPVFQAIRPCALSLSVSQGKGLTRDAARVSALMEAIELHAAERIVADGHGPADAAEARLWGRMPPARGQPRPFAAEQDRGWITATDLAGGRACRVPVGLVSMDCTRPREDDLWPNTNGLAAGNTLAEAKAAALCEALERDAQARWLAATPAARRRRAIDPATIRHRSGRWLLARIARAGLRCALWDMSAAHGIATIGCAIVEPGPAAGLALPPAFGAACHPCAATALAGAIGEAAQTRIALIAGSRDDLSPADYADPGGRRTALMVATRDFGGGGGRCWSHVPDGAPADATAARERLLRIAGMAGCPIVPCLDLTPPGAPFAVVRIVLPGLGDHDRPSSLPAPA